MKTRVLILMLVLTVSLLVAGLALANGGVDMTREVLGGGATEATAGSVTLRATLGQPVVRIISGGDVTLGQGFWHGGAEAEYSVYLPLVIRH